MIIRSSTCGVVDLLPGLLGDTHPRHVFISPTALVFEGDVATLDYSPEDGRVSL